MDILCPAVFCSRHDRRSVIVVVASSGWNGLGSSRVQCADIAIREYHTHRSGEEEQTTN